MHNRILPVLKLDLDVTKSSSNVVAKQFNKMFGVLEVYVDPSHFDELQQIRESLEGFLNLLETVQQVSDVDAFVLLQDEETRKTRVIRSLSDFDFFIDEIKSRFSASENLIFSSSNTVAVPNENTTHFTPDPQFPTTGGNLNELPKSQHSEESEISATVPEDSAISVSALLARNGITHPFLNESLSQLLEKREVSTETISEMLEDFASLSESLIESADFSEQIAKISNISKNADFLNEATDQEIIGFVSGSIKNVADIGKSIGSGIATTYRFFKEKGKEKREKEKEKAELEKTKAEANSAKKQAELEVQNAEETAKENAIEKAANKASEVENEIDAVNPEAVAKERKEKNPGAATETYQKANSLANAAIKTSENSKYSEVKEIAKEVKAMKTEMQNKVSKEAEKLENS